MAELSSSRGPLGSGRGGVTDFVGGSASSVFAHGGALVNTGIDPAMYAYTNTAHIHAVTASRV